MMSASNSSIVDGIVVGASGGAIAGLTLSLAHLINTKVVESIHKRRVFSWLKRNVPDLHGNRHRSTRAIASHTNLTEDRVRFICSHHGEIYLSTGNEDDMWGLYGIGREKPKE